MHGVVGKHPCNMRYDCTLLCTAMSTALVRGSAPQLPQAVSADALITTLKIIAA